MKTFLKNLLTASMLFSSLTASAQCVKLDERMKQLISEYSEKYCTNKTINEARNPSKPNRPLQSRCEIYYFTLKKKDSYQRELLDEMLRAMETYGREDPNFYGINTMSGRENAAANRRRLMIGEGTESYVEIGKDHDNYLNVNILDEADSTKTHRYAYAVEWSERDKHIYLRYIVTYAKIPSVTGTLQYNATMQPFDFGPSIIDKIKGHQDSIYIKYPELNTFIKKYDRWLRLDSIKYFNQTINNGNFLLNFYNLNHYYWNNVTTDLTAISIYQLCKTGREHGVFKNPDAVEEWEQVMAELDKLIEVAKTETDRKYFLMAREQLQKIFDKGEKR